ncbi:hypothetical protein Hanom_Chr03g00202011 [Helianthus anomalus]
MLVSDIGFVGQNLWQKVWYCNTLSNYTNCRMKIDFCSQYMAKCLVLQYNFLKIVRI